MYSSQTQITLSKYYNLSVTFQLSTYNSQLYNPNIIYFCCTTLQGAPTNSCTQVYLKGTAYNINTNPPPTVSTTTTTTLATTTKPTVATTTKPPVTTTKAGVTMTQPTIALTTTPLMTAAGLPASTTQSKFLF